MNRVLAERRASDGRLLLGNPEREDSRRGEKKN